MAWRGLAEGITEYVRKTSAKLKTNKYYLFHSDENDYRRHETKKATLFLTVVTIASRIKL